MATDPEPPIRNSSLAAAAVYSHSGEFAPTYTDLRLHGRGVNLTIERSYRSSFADVVGLFGRGWISGLDRRIGAVGDDLVHYDATGRTQTFARDLQGRRISPQGCYAVLQEGSAGLELSERHGRAALFEPVADGGRLRALVDANGNELGIAYAPDEIVMTDSLARQVRVRLAGELVTEVADYTGRRLTYTYDGDARLVQVVLPASSDVPGGSTVRYVYDSAHRLVKVVDARGRTYLENVYDNSGRVVEQQYGAGGTVLAYENTGSGVRTTCRSRAGGVVLLMHDVLGHLVSRTVEVRREAFSAEDLPSGAGSTVALVTTFELNQHSEVVARVDPAGGSTAWTFTEDDPDPRNRGNLVGMVRMPQAGVPADQGSLVTTIEVERTFQRIVAVTDPSGQTTRHAYDQRGNLTATEYPPVTLQLVGDGAVARPAPVLTSPADSFAVNAAGQRLRTTHADGTVTAYMYYPEDDPDGLAGGEPIDDPAGGGGYLARVTRDAAGVRETTAYAYDSAGRQTRVVDPLGNAAELVWSPAGQVEEVRGRLTGHTLVQHHDEAGNLVASIWPLTLLVLDRATGIVTPNSAMRTERREYDALDQLVTRTLEGESGRIIERFERDTDGRVIRHTQPEGEITEYTYDERGLVVERILGVGRPEAATERYTWTPDGSLRSRTDSQGEVTKWLYDGFGRCTGAIDAAGTTWSQLLDPAGHTTLLTVTGTKDSGPAQRAETAYWRDEWGRPIRIDRVWRDPEGRPLGRSGYDGEEGVVSGVVEYGANGRPAAVWGEGNNVMRLSWDGAGRLTRIRSAAGDELTMKLDAAGNAVELSYRGPDSAAGQFALSLRAEYDAMERLVRRQVGDDPAETFRYDESGALIDHVHSTGLRIQHLRDDLGRRIGLLINAPGIGFEDSAPIVRRFDYDRNFRLSAAVDAAGNRTAYSYDALGRQVALTRADGAVVRAQYDGSSNTVRAVDENGTETINRFDAAGRLVESRTTRELGGPAEVERFDYDALGRLVAATSGTGTVRWTYDTLSRPLTEERDGRIVRVTYDPAGNPVELAYPGGDRVRRRFDKAGRTVSVDTAAGEQIARVSYRYGEQVARLELGGELLAACAYDAEQRLTSIEYRRISDGGLVEGFRYRYDAVGLPVEAVRITELGESAERYQYDAAGRARLVRYNVASPVDPNSTFGSETSYEPLPDGMWARRVDRDGSGAVLADRTGEVNERNRYRRFGDDQFETDAAGDVIRRSGPQGTCLYSYDGEHRLVRLACFDLAGSQQLMVIYGYDALGRLALRTVTDTDSTSTHYAYVWAGNVLLEEYENGQLARSYMHSVGSLPAVLRTVGPVAAKHLYVHDGRGIVSGLVNVGGNNSFAEKYSYEITGAPFLTEIAGVPVALPDRASTRSALLNSVLSGAPGVLQDWQTRLMAGLGGRHLDPQIAAILNGVAQMTGKSHVGLRETLAAQLSSTLAMLGLGGWSQPPQLSGAGRMSRGISEYMDSDTPLRGVSLIPPQRNPANPAFDFSGRAPGTTNSSDSSIVRTLKDILNTPVRVGPGGGLETSVGDLIGGVLRGVHPSDKSKEPASPDAVTPSGTGGANQAEKNAHESADKQKKEQAEKQKAEKEAADKVQREYEKQQKKEKEEADKKKSIVEDDDKLVAESHSYTAITLTPAQVEAKLNGLKHPENPNGGSGRQPVLDLSSPPPRQGGLDPTIAYFPYDGPLGGWAGGSVPTQLIIAPIDFGQGNETAAFRPPDPGAGNNIDPSAHRP